MAHWSYHNYFKHFQDVKLQVFALVDGDSSTLETFEVDPALFHDFRFKNL